LNCILPQLSDADIVNERFVVGSPKIASVYPCERLEVSPIGNYTARYLIHWSERGGHAWECTYLSWTDIGIDDIDDNRANCLVE
jgi:hypothetical protein